MNKFKKGDMVRHILLQRVGEFIRYGSLTGEECYVNFVDEDGYDDCLCVTTSLLESYEERENMDMNMNGHTMKDINYDVCVEWGIDSDGKGYCNGTLSKLKPENKEEAYNNDGFNFIGKGGGEGAEYYCYATISEAIKNAAYNPFCIEYCGDFTEEEIKELHLAISEMYEEGKLDQYKIHDTKSLVDNFVNDFDKYRAKIEKE